jgi:endonuclease YncB( thermonuclease family)
MRLLRRHLTRRDRAARSLAAVFVCMWAAGSAAQTITDGDTLKLNGTTYRLWGIDALETRQACADGWMGGIEATKTLIEMTRGRAVSCQDRVKDRYGRTVALCRADGRDLGAAMVSAGMAYAFTRYSSDYIGQEKSALAARLGVHAHDCEKPWDWRARNRGDR